MGFLMGFHREDALEEAERLRYWLKWNRARRAEVAAAHLVLEAIS
jgi:hypothetical protein